MMTAFTRTLILYFLIMLGLRLMGKRQIGELEPSELVLTMMISDLATVPMQDFGIPLLAGVIPILTLLALSMLLSQLSLYNSPLSRTDMRHAGSFNPPRGAAAENYAEKIAIPWMSF
ncbi:MAG: hypothetical protein V8R75_09010 [Oscillospiraceae bacterium]